MTTQADVGGGDVETDVVVIGGGPAGALAARQLAEAGRRVVVIERERFPRFHIGESMLPRTLSTLRRLGLESPLRRLPHAVKRGAEFGMGGGSETTLFDFDRSLLNKDDETFNIERARFDQMLLQKAETSGAQVLQGVAIRDISMVDDEQVVLSAEGRRFTGRYVIDASGQATLLARHKGLRKPNEEICFQKVAYFEHVTGVRRLGGQRAGYPCFAICEEGWLWLIPLDDERMSVGLVLDADVARSIDVPATEMLAWGVARCPLIADRMGDARLPAKNQTIADFSYRCPPYAGPGFFLTGDAAAFLDPVFSTGVQLAMETGMRAASEIDAVLGGARTPEAARRRYRSALRRLYKPYFQAVRMFYDPDFRDLFLQGKGPFRMAEAVIAVLTGHTMPVLPFSVCWRLKVLRCCVAMHRRRAITTRRPRYSLVTESQLPVDSKTG